MKFKKFNLLFIFFFIPFYVISQQNSKSDAGGPPGLQELIGFWKMVPLPNKDKLNKVNPWPLPYQWFAFSGTGKVYSMMASGDGNYSAKDLDEVFKDLPQDKVPNYKLDGQFVTIDNPEIKNYLELWGVNLLAKDVGSVAKNGDLIMTLDGGQDSIIYYRLLRRVK